MTTTTSIQLTEGQQGVLAMYDKEIAYEQRAIKEAETAWLNGGSYEELRYHRDCLEVLVKERRLTLEDMLTN